MLFGCVLAAAVWQSGCAEVKPPLETAVQAAEPRPFGALQRLVRTPPSRPDEQPVELADEPLPLQFPRSDASDPADDTEPDRPASGVLDTIRRTVEASPVFEESGVQEQLLDGLSEAQAEMSRIKAENRRALRAATRQVRVGGAAASPNLILISAERVGYGDLSCYGQTLYTTPRIDELAGRGIRFTQFYSGSAHAHAARWCLLTGLNSGRAPVPPQGEERHNLRDERDTLAETLWQAGYSTGFVGLWAQDGLPIEHGFDEWTGFRTRAEAVPYPETIHVDTARARILANADEGRQIAAGGLLLDEALDFIARQATAGRPFFLHLAVPAEITATTPETSRAQRLAELDALVGRLSDWLEKTHLTPRTCLVFLGETAPHASDPSSGAPTADLRSTSDGLGEGNLRVPLIVAWPERIAAGSTAPHLSATWDILPTMAELAQAQRRPPRLDGLSFVPTLLGRPQREHVLMYWETRGSAFGQAVRKGQWKGVRHAGQSTLSLYDLAADPQESTDLAARRPDIVAQFVVRKR
jgi:arylsulfatase A-like enzyme